MQIPVSGIKEAEGQKVTVAMPMGQGQAAAVIPTMQEEIPRKEEERQEADSPGGQDQSKEADF